MLNCLLFQAKPKIGLTKINTILINNKYFRSCEKKPYVALNIKSTLGEFN